jgi:hypothetical protein
LRSNAHEKPTSVASRRSGSKTSAPRSAVGASHASDRIWIGEGPKRLRLWALTLLFGGRRRRGHVPVSGENVLQRWRRSAIVASVIAEFRTVARLYKVRSRVAYIRAPQLRRLKVVAKARVADGLPWAATRLSGRLSRRDRLQPAWIAFRLAVLPGRARAKTASYNALERCRVCPPLSARV